MEKEQQVLWDLLPVKLIPSQWLVANILPCMLSNGKRSSLTLKIATLPSSLGSGNLSSTYLSTENVRSFVRETPTGFFGRNQSSKLEMISSISLEITGQSVQRKMIIKNITDSISSKRISKASLKSKSMNTLSLLGNCSDGCCLLSSAVPRTSRSEEKSKRKEEKNVSKSSKENKQEMLSVMKR